MTVFKKFYETVMKSKGNETCKRSILNALYNRFLLIINYIFIKYTVAAVLYQFPYKLNVM